MSERITVALADGFLEAYAALPRQTQRKASAFINKFMNDPRQPSLNYEKIQSALNLYSVRIDDTYRAIVLREDQTGTYLLLWVDHHDEAYAWARRRRCEVNPRTGVLQVYQTTAVEAPQDALLTIPAVAPMRPATPAPAPAKPFPAPASAPARPLFEDVSDDDLMELGLPEPLLGFVRTLTAEEEFLAAQDTLPRDAHENLTWLVHGFPVGEVKELCGVAPVIDGDGTPVPAPIPATIAEALETDAAKRGFRVVEGEDELFQILNAPLDKWRVFLHPSQRKLVEKTFNGPARVLGGAGTGKTVVAMHRARRLASQITSPRERVLFTTFGKNLAADIRANLRELCTAEEMRRIEVINLDAWVARFLRENGFDFRIEYGEKKLRDLWDEAKTLAASDLDFEPQFFLDEWARVVVPQEAFSFADYAHARRVGRGTRLSRPERAEIWKVMEQYLSLMKERRVRDADYAFYEAKVVLENKPGTVRYRHIVVDEAQDFSPSAFKLLRSLGGPQHPDDLFMVGDAHQRIYGKKVTLSACGVDIRGRGNKLRINYRTTEETRRSAESVLAGADYDDLDGGTDALDGTQSLTHGEAPEFKCLGSRAAETAWIDERVRVLLDEGVQEKDIFIVLRKNDLVEDFAGRLRAAGHDVAILSPGDEDDRSVDGLRVAGMHRVKGLEFDYVFVGALDEGIVPPSSAVREAQRRGTEKELLQEERNLLYVAMTRAKRRVFLSCGGRPSSLVEEVKA